MTLFASLLYVLSIELLCSSDCQIIMNVLWTRLAETGKNWRIVYKVSAEFFLYVEVASAIFPDLNICPHL